MIAKALRRKKKTIFLVILIPLLLGCVITVVFTTGPPWWWTKEEEGEMVTKEDIKKFEQNITDLIMPSEYNIETTCEKIVPPVWKDSAIFVGKCTVMHRPLSVERSHLYLLDILFRPDWRNSESAVHYIMCIYSKSNEISIFVENNTIKMKVTSDRVEHILKLPLNEVNWKEEGNSNESNNIKMMWNPNNKEIWVEVNDVRNSIFGDIEFDFSNATFLLGSSKNKKYFAEGWFNRIKGYSSSEKGSVTSIIKDAESIGGRPRNVWEKVMFYGSIPAGTSVDISVNTSKDNTTWSGWQLLQSNASSGITYDIPSSYQKRYGQWRLTLQTNYPSLTPSIHNVTFITG